MRQRATRAFLVLLALPVVLAGCSESEVNPYDALQDPNPPVVTSFVYSGGEASWSTDEEALCVLEYGPVGGDYEHYVYGSAKYHTTFHSVTLLGMDEGVEYAVRIRSMDRAGNEAYDTAVALPDTIIGAAFSGEIMSLSMIDVGWGLSELLKTPGGEYILIDAAHTDHLDDVMDFLADHGVGSLTAAVMTHSHSDHYGGFPADGGIFESLWINGMILPDTTTLYNSIPLSILEGVEQYGIPITYVKQGDTSDSVPGLDWDDTPGFRVQVLSAGVGGTIFEDDDSGTEGMNTNNDSVVLRMTFGNVSFITTGDAEHFTEFGIIDEFGRLGARAQVLQIAHHGSDDSSSEQWLENVSPRVALISCAMVEVALVKEVVLQGCRAVDADYFVTDKAFPNMSRGADPEYGNLITMTDGESIEVMAEHHDW